KLSPHLQTAEHGSLLSGHENPRWRKSFRSRDSVPYSNHYNYYAPQSLVPEAQISAVGPCSGPQAVQVGIRGFSPEPKTRPTAGSAPGRTSRFPLTLSAFPPCARQLIQYYRPRTQAQTNKVLPLLPAPPLLQAPPYFNQEPRPSSNPAPSPEPRPRSSTLGQFREAPPLPDCGDAGARPQSEEYGVVGGFPRRAQSWPLRCRLARSCAGPAAEPRVLESPKPAAGEPGALRGAQILRTESRGRGQLAARDPGPPPPPLQRKAQQLSEATDSLVSCLLPS
ncbi:hypothetical protein U0070_020098, partial [Myodes glareolus]